MAELATVLEVTCPGDHQHAHMLDGASRPTERYPPRLVKAILQTLRRHMREHAGLTLSAVEVTVGPHVDEDIPEIRFDETSPVQISTATSTQAFPWTWTVFVLRASLRSS